MGRRIAIIGAGPIGLEAALYGAALGHDVQVFERGRVGGNVRAWGHVRLFSPWKLNVSALGLAALARAGLPQPPPDATPTGAELLAQALEPLARTPELAGRIREGAEVIAIGRDRLGKRAPLGAARAARGFRLLVRRDGHEEVVTADIVLDCSGTWATPNWLGNADIPAPGERAHAGRIHYWLEDYAGAAAARYAGQRLLLVGAGHSAATALDQLLAAPEVHLTWVYRAEVAQPYQELDPDPLPERARLVAQANRVAAGADPRVEVHPGTVVEGISDRADALEVVLAAADGRRETIVVDRILALVGYRPDRSLSEALQVHECYASAGPMKLAASLLGASSADCLAQPSASADLLATTEPGYFVLGAKSYGRTSTFLLRTGFEQVRDVFTLIQGDPTLDLYR